MERQVWGQRVLAVALAVAGVLLSDARVLGQTTTLTAPLQVTAKATVSASGALTALDVTNLQSVGVQLTGTWSGTIEFDASAGGAGGTFVAVACTPIGSGLSVTSTTANGLWSCPLNGANAFRLNATAWTSGSATANVIAQASSVSAGTTVQQGTPPWTIKPDGTSWTLTGTSANINVTNTVAASQSGSWTVQQGGAPWSIQGPNANNAAVTQQPVLGGGVAVAAGANPTSVTGGNASQFATDQNGALFVRDGGPNVWHCSLTGVAASLTQCQAAPAAGLRLYITDMTVQSNTSTSGTFSLQSGTGTNCATGTAAIFPASGTSNRYGYPANTSGPSVWNFNSPLALSPAVAVCAVGTATNTLNIDLLGFIAP